MPMNLYMKKCPIEDGKVSTEKLSEWRKSANSGYIEHLIPLGSEQKGIIKSGERHEGEIRCVCSAVMKLEDGVALLEFQGRATREPGSINADYECCCPVWDSNMQHLDQIREYFQPFREDESDV